ncbi:putative feruloyl esterase A [Hypsizygus marmoreus]|uniref:Feruloyl esterase A n=1 Tax=Hypsizygus marmoreus TaxID=39966 RepID=A0A369JWQ0_HYPMA|nr:putative feruloyl esterase A [Hypsizygus marmoreus]
MSDNQNRAISGNAIPGSLSANTIPGSVYNDLVHYFKYASSAYCLVCPRPNGNTLVLPISNTFTDIQGFIARDEHRKEIIVALRGSASYVDFLMDMQLVLIPLITPGVVLPPDTRVHSGFLLAWNSVALQILAIVSQQIKSHPGFSIVTTGHSLGGALSTLAAVSLRSNFPDKEVRTYSYGAPRTGNQTFANYVNEKFGSRAFRVVHTTDGVPTIISKSLGYSHHGIEYWLSADPPSKETIRKCSADGEDPSCSASIPSRGFTPAHAMYFGITVSTPFCL